MTRGAGLALVAAAGAVALAACGDNDPVRVRKLTGTVVYGQVAVGAGSVTDVTVRAGYAITSCSGAVNTGGSGAVHPDATGRYRVALSSSRSPFTGCVKVEAVTGTGSALTRIEDDVPFARDANLDSVRVDFSFPCGRSQEAPGTGHVCAAARVAGAPVAPGWQIAHGR